ncbi:hypothetical protein BB561_004174 [Smittium simulii]|uniref:Brix domain-containing protein n=1 Tax=Smittium simulii TaxID=133385 RepID=A0A2T9YHR0_9FUNG|nr:hypothetical protein BB561_004174 [Smittium simulii]
MGISKKNLVVEPNSIKNKAKRLQLYSQQRIEKAKNKRETRKRLKLEEKDCPEAKKERLEKNVPNTQENTREFDETIAGIEFALSVKNIIPDAEFIKRGSQYSLEKIMDFCVNREYTDLLVVSEDHREPTYLTVIHLPNGPTAKFRITRVKDGKKIEGHGNPTAHKPEVILNNFSTRLGHTVGKVFASLFPQLPEFEGRQAVTFHNQRDFIFFRRHRYEFVSGKRVNLQEIGPRFTLRLQWLQKGLYDLKSGEYEWIFKPEMETSRRKFFL